jgi:Sensors of blue-light using FAD
MLVRLLYVSRAARPLNPPEIEGILAQCRAHNPALGITGVLCCSGQLFTQVLEGGRSAVNTLYNTIVRDPRHVDVTILHYEEISERRFAHWTMGQVNLAKVNPQIVLKFSETPVPDPYAVSGAASMALLEELMASAAIIGKAG